MKIGDLIRLSEYGKQYYDKVCWGFVALVVGHGGIQFPHAWKLLTNEKIEYISIFDCDKYWDVISAANKKEE